MTIVVINCFDWIEFHFVEKLLEQGVKVIGVHEKQTDRTLFLEMFFARNSSFDCTKKIPKEAERVIVIGDTHMIPRSKHVMQCMHRETSIEQHIKGRLYVYIPLLFGEWMPMDKTGMYLGQRHIPYHSEEFQDEAVYVKDFVNDCLSEFNQTIEHRKENTPYPWEGLILEKGEQIRDNRTKRINIEKMQKHYLKYASFYDT